VDRVALDPRCWHGRTTTPRHMTIPDRLRRLKDATHRAIYQDRVLARTAKMFAGGAALEPGGPSSLFGRDGLVPIYRHLATLDILDYADRTLWSDGDAHDLRPRKRLIAEAGQLDEIPDDTYDAVLASHVLEHLANPIGALREWRRVVRPGGYVLLIVPHRDGTFDHRRPITPLKHMREDVARHTSEADLTHLPEILKLHDLEHDPGVPDRSTFELRCRENLSSRVMHHHVFISQTVAGVCQDAELDVSLLRPTLPYNIVCLCGVGPSDQGSLGDREFMDVLKSSPFPSDRSATIDPSEVQLPPVEN
jgi:SAM-dependent methyltransferase